MKFSWVLILIFVVTFGLLNCSKTPVDVSGVEGGNTSNASIKGIVINEKGEPLKGVLISIRTSNYLPNPIEPHSLDSSKMIDIFTDENGEFIIESLEQDSYSLEFFNESLGSIHELFIDKDTIYDLSQIKLAPTKTVVGTVKSIDNYPAYIQVKGLERLVLVDNQTGMYQFNLPEGEHELIINSGSPNSLPIIQYITTSNQDTLSVGSLKILEDLNKWDHQASLKLNLSGEGLILNQNILEYPLLIRLTSDFFGFNEAQSDGRDLRIFNSKRPLDYQIENWDKENQKAEIWLLVDTIFTDESKNEIQIFWGNTATQPYVYNHNVFTNNFAGVFHLDENSPDTGTLDVYKNSAKAQYRGKDNVIHTGKSGVIGLGQEFDGFDDRIDFGTWDPTTGNMTLSLWARWNGETGRSQHFISKTDDWSAPESRWSFAYNTYAKDLRFESFPGSTFKLTMPDSSEWHHYVVTHRYADSTTILYIDGEAIGDTIHVAFGPNVNGNLLIGNYNSGPLDFSKNEGFNGALDEVRISESIRSQQWIKLNYLNQKLNSRLVSGIRIK